MSEWKRRAACRKEWVDREWFFPTDTEQENADGELRQAYGDAGLRARLICAACPVRELCWAENRDAEVGIFAGTDEAERRRMRSAAERREQRAAASEGRPARGVGFKDLPAPIFRPHIARPSTRVQIALYSFMRGATIAEAADVADLPLDPIRRAVVDQQRHVA